MPEYPNLVNAPVQEALIDFRVRLPPDVRPDTLRRLADGLKEEYPKVTSIRQFEGQIQIRDEVPVSTQAGPRLLGYRLESDDGRHVAQIRVDGFTFSRLAPYESWDRMIENAWIVWKPFVEATKPLGIERVATRFINRIALPSSGQLGDILRAPPQVTEGRMEAFLFRYQLAVGDGATAVVSLATADSPEQAVILDIDCFVRRSLSPTDSKMIRRYLEKVRDSKNRIFFRALTQQAIEDLK